MRQFHITLCTILLTSGAALAAVPVPTAQELQDLQSVPASGYIVYGLGAISSDDYAANGIRRINLRSTTAVNLSATGRVPIIHPANGDLIAFAQPVTPGSTSFNIVMMSADGGNKRTVTRQAMPNINKLSWTDRGMIVFTAGDQVERYHFPGKIWITDTTGTVREIPQNGKYTINPSVAGAGIDGVWLARNRILVRNAWNVYLHQIDEDHIENGVGAFMGCDTQRCGVTMSPDWNTCMINIASHTAFSLRSLDNLSEIRQYAVVPGGWSNDFTWSNDMDWACFVTNQGVREVYVKQLSTDRNVRHSWTDQGIGLAVHNPDMWIGDVSANTVQAPIIDPTANSFVDSLRVALTCNTAGATIYYTTNGTDPTTASTAYSAAFIIRGAQSITVKAFAVKAGLSNSSISQRTYLPIALRQPDNPGAIIPGIAYSCFEGQWSQLPNFASLTAASTGTIASFVFPANVRADNFGVSFTGYISIPVNGAYTFFTNSDDGSRLYIGNSCIVNNDGSHAAQEASGSIGLATGLHAITVNYFEGTAGQSLLVSYQGPGGAKSAIPASALFRPDTATSKPMAMVSPTGGQYRLGDTLHIRWLYEKGAHDIIELSLNAGRSYDIPLFGGEQFVEVDSINRYDWVIPKDAGYLTSAARVRIHEYSWWAQAISASFSIVDALTAGPGARHFDAGRGDRLIVRNGRMAVAPAAGIMLVDMRGKAAPAVASGARGNIRHGVYIAVTGDGSMRKQEKLLMCR